MNTKLILAILLICMAGLLFGSENPADMDEMQRRSQELKALSERFKADKGFEGVIETNTEVMKLSHFRGNFKDIDMTGVSDTLAFRQVCNKIISKLLPYIGAKENQLDAGKISISSTSTRTRYQQRVNGYPIEGNGYLNIFYDFDRNRFTILNVTVDIASIPLSRTVTQEDAFKIARTAFEQTELCNDSTPPWRSKSVILYKSRIMNGEEQPYRLYWRITFPNVSYYVDAETSEWFQEGYVVNNMYTYTVQGSTYSTTSGFPSLSFQPMKGIEISNGGLVSYTNEDGTSLFPNVPDASYQVTLQSDRYSIRSVNSPNILTVSNVTPNEPNNYQTPLYDVLSSGNSVSLYAPNIYYHIYEQDQMFQKNHEEFNEAIYPIIVNDDPDMSSILGLFDPRISEIHLYNGRNSHTIRHEASHFFTYRVMGYHQFYESFEPINASHFQAMDEAFAEYWLSVGINSTVHDDGDELDIQGVDVNDVYTTYNSQQLPFNEGFYSYYFNRYPIASAWWTLRSNPIFGSPDPISQVKAFDKALVEVLATDVDVSFSDRYKPRYFYNLLMAKYSTDNQTWTLNDKQIAIKDAYISRGLNFYPKVESISEYSKDRNVFGLNEPVHVKISNCPQNTAANIYIVKHNEYTYTDGALLPTLSSHFPSGFSPLTSVVTSPLGEWEGFLWTTAEEGEFDIIVDFGSPSTPDGIIRFSFSGANVMDGFDGRTMPGFRVTGLAGIATNSLNELYTSSLQIAISD